ncbi:MAG: nicotinate (nicotinamide) nucleotide adenylyltransferase [Clostridia bacterium]|nr:nicotinate (nicotinamide) nucleotide adenylyltransferase [Clostridia bacterium]
MRIAVYGGSFDPPHKGHKLLAENLAGQCGAEKVIVIPTAMSPFKDKSGATSADRYEMCRLAFSEPLFEVSDIEIVRGGKSYTVDTLRKVKQLYPQSQLYLFMGDDMFLSLDRWYKYEEILDLCTVVAACRTTRLEKLHDMKEFAKKVLNMNSDSFILCESVPLQISSTEIRMNLKNGVGDYLEEEVFTYIKNRGLYL